MTRVDRLITWAGILGLALFTGCWFAREKPWQTSYGQKIHDQILSRQCADYKCREVCDTLEERLFGVDARPHQAYLYTDIDLAWASTVENLRWMQKHAFGEVVFFETLYIDRAQPTPGVGYEYTHPNLVAETMDAVRAMGAKVVGYVHPYNWRAAGFSAVDLLAEIERHGWDGVYFDGGDIGDNPEQTIDVLERLERSGISRTLHRSVEPWASRRLDWLTLDWVRILRLCNYAQWGETNRNPRDLTDPIWETRIAYRWLGCKTIAIFSPSKLAGDELGVYWRGEGMAGWYEKMPTRKIGGIARFSPWYGDKWTALYWPAYTRARDEYRASR